ncbi:MAG: glycerol-3-phosphate 1-O-acyltransferase PlsY [Candidatus Aminicenantes bacterium]|nr:glycerol-3-phosphate 1-O-acyltransferase PlsY [Candidatus Aminicenantes bacterium]
MIKALILASLAYLVGSIPTGYLLFKIKAKKDIRSLGSGSTGATNILRTSGLLLALIVLALDIAKGALPAVLIKRSISSPSLGLLCSFLATLGHCFPIFIGFRGGKGVATSLGVFAVYSWPSVLVAAFIFLVTVAATRFVSLGSLVSSLSMVPLIYFFFHDLKFLLVTILFIFLIWIKHRENLKRLWRGEENKLGKRLKK